MTLTNAQAALIAAASVPPNPNMVSLGSNTDTLIKRAEDFKSWLDYQDKQTGAEHASF